MNRPTVRIVLIAIAVAGIGLAGCSISGPDVSIEDRIKDFESDLDNGNIDQLYEHIHPDSDKRNALKKPANWNFEEESSYNFISISDSGDSRKVDVESNDVDYSPEDTWKFDMKEDEPGPLARKTWYIKDISSENGNPDPMPSP
ncbi:MAG: hypothetical protein R6V29_03430 [Spirochaetia bacterium]